MANDKEKIGYTSWVAKQARFEDQTPKLYRLARKKDGSLILQGAYFWQDGNNYGHEWRDIPTVELEE